MERINIPCEIEVCRPEELDEKDRQLIKAAMTASMNAYAPYSGFSVGAAVRFDNDGICTGSNQENASYPCGICAERVALFQASSQHPERAITTLAIAANIKGTYTESPCPPCGLCRQAILECEKRQNGHPIRLLLSGSKECYIIRGGAKSLLPLQFDENMLH